MKSHSIPQHIIRLTVLFALALLALIIARLYLVPPSFGKYGHYRAEAVNEIMSQEVKYAGYKICIECHDDINEQKEKSSHWNVSCEVCHGPAMKHVEEPDEYTPSAPRGRGYCPLCHGFNPSRPTGFPQIITAFHNPGKACMTCHNPHEPLLPHTPEECSACHREIANEKRVSHHTSLSCERCHIVSDDHLVNPRYALAQKPANREFCGQCHSRDADSQKDVPRIDIKSHGEHYLCWDCHYPHSPEVR